MTSSLCDNVKLKVDISLLNPRTDKILMSPPSDWIFAHCSSPGCDFRTAWLASAMSANSQIWTVRTSLNASTKRVFKVLAVQLNSKDFHTGRNVIDYLSWKIFKSMQVNFHIAVKWIAISVRPGGGRSIKNNCSMFWRDGLLWSTHNLQWMG